MEKRLCVRSADRRLDMNSRNTVSVNRLVMLIWSCWTANCVYDEVMLKYKL